MSKEEAIKILKSKMDGNTDTSYEWAETVRMAIDALKEQGNPNSIRINFVGEKETEEFKEYLKPKEYVLDKIKAEIEQKCSITVGRECDSAITLYDVFQIIDKYKAESEV